MPSGPQTGAQSAKHSLRRSGLQGEGEGDGGGGGQPSCSWRQHHNRFLSDHISFVRQSKGEGQPSPMFLQHHFDFSSDHTSLV